MDKTKLAELVSRMPTPHPQRGILSDVDKPAVEAALAELEAGGADVVPGLAGMLADTDPARDSKVRHAIHAMVTRACGAGDERRKAIATALAEAVGKPRDAAEPTAFLIRQLQFCGGAEAVPALAKHLDDDRLGPPALAALQAIGQPSAEALRNALPSAKGRTRLGVILALGAIKDAKSADALHPLAAAPDADTRLAACWAIASIGDPAAVDVLLKAPLGTGYERNQLNKATFLLAENLAKAGKAELAMRLYVHLRETRTGEKEAHVRDAADRGLAGLRKVP